MAEMHKPSGRQVPGQTYPTESGAPHPEAPPTESPDLKRANQPETFETNAYDREDRVEDRPDLAHMTGGRATELPETDAHSSEPPIGLASSPARQERVLHRGDDASIRNEKEIVAHSQDEFPDQSMGRRWEWTDEERMPGDMTYGAVPFAALALLAAGIAVAAGVAVMWKRRRREAEE
jgi:hypothetical protein